MYKKYYLSLLLVSGVVLLAFSIMAITKEINPEWKDYQSEYKKLFMDKAEDGEMSEKAISFKVGHQQIYLSTLKRVDRCMNCHLGVENPLMANVEIPYKQHSGNYLDNHPIAKFGCTVCHDGQGRATNKREAHGTELNTHWDTPVLPMEYIESSCARCHDSEMLKSSGAAKVDAGKWLFREKGCRGCHKLDGIGGVLGKALDGIGSQPIHYFPLRHVEGDKTSYSWLKEHFIDPRKIVPESEMKVTLNDEEAEFLTIYALTIKTEEIPKQYRRIRHYREEPMDGEALYKMYCIACHTDGKFSIYDEVFSRTVPAIMNPQFLKTIDDGFMETIIKEGHDDTQMTAWKSDAAGLTNEEIERILKYLTRNRPDERPDSFAFAGFNTDIKHGEELYKIRCVLCHGDDGKAGKDLLGVDLKNPVVQNADPEFLAITVRDGRPGTPMVPFGMKGLKLDNQKIADIVAYLRTLSNKAGSEK